jgi:hypothetical protein
MVFTGMQREIWKHDDIADMWSNHQMMRQKLISNSFRRAMTGKTECHKLCSWIPNVSNNLGSPGLGRDSFEHGWLGALPYHHHHAISVIQKYSVKTIPSHSLACIPQLNTGTGPTSCTEYSSNTGHSCQQCGGVEKKSITSSLLKIPIKHSNW